MSRGRFVGGAAPPPGWSVEAAFDHSNLIAAARSAWRAGSTQFVVPGERGAGRTRALGPETVDFGRRIPGLQARIDLLAGLDPNRNWLPRDQGRRATCVAFAVAAAEELATLRATNDLPTYFEEDLYCAIRKVTLAEIGIGAGIVDPDSGLTFLAQAAIAIDRGGLRTSGTPYDPKRPVAWVIDCADSLSGGANTDVARSVATAKSNVIAPGIDWPARQPLIELFLEALEKGHPVVVALPILDRATFHLFHGTDAATWGRVAYPTDPAEITQTTAEEGHAICLVGYIPSEELGHEGWFVFRNSHGTADFASDANEDVSSYRAPAPGYGTISATDVERWCWEYLYRA